VPVPEKDLPVELPYDVDHKPQGKPPLATATDWMEVKCPKCEGKATREPETMDGFIDNSWYFYRYLSPHDKDHIFDKDLVKKWLPINIYFGGSEHTLGHTMYSRFFTKFFYDIGLVDKDEYALKRFNHGVILGPDGARMSKSHGNVVNPDDQVKDYGADAVRLYLAFIGPYDIVAPWNPGGLQGVYHFLQRVWGLQERLTINDERLTMNDLKIMHKTIKKIAEDLEQIKFNTPVAALMEWLNHLSRKETISRQEYKTFLILLSPFAPHTTEELWQILGEKLSIHQQSYPKFDDKFLVEEEVSIVIQVNGKVRDILLIGKDMISNKEVIEKMALESAKIKSHIGEKKVMKTIYVQGRVFNIVI
jgi:leucyl-tRNA synthetase